MNDLGMERKSPFSRLQWIRRAAGGGADSYWVVGVGGKVAKGGISTLHSRSCSRPCRRTGAIFVSLSSYSGFLSLLTSWTRSFFGGGRGWGGGGCPVHTRISINSGILVSAY